MYHTTVLTIALLLLLLASRLSHASTADSSCGIIWDEPILLSDTNYNAHSPKIALSGEDTVHIVWSSSTGATRLPYVRSVDGGSSFGPRVELLSDSLAFTGRANRPSVVAWHSNVYVFFQGPASDTPIRMVKSTTGGETWQYPVDISPDTTGPPPLTPTILGDTIVMTYEPRGEPLPWILRSTDAGVTWENVSSGVRIFHRLALGPRVTPSAGGVLHLAQIASNETQYRRSHDLGDTWVQQTLLSTVDGLQSSDPTIAASTTPGDTTVIAAWRDPKYGCIGVFGCSIIGRTGQVGDSLTIWDPEHVHTPEPRGFEPSLAMHGGRNAVAWRYEVNPGMTYHALVQISDTGIRSWCAPTDITPETQFKVITVEVALSNIAVHVVWSQNVAPDPSTFRIFYRRGRFMTTDVREEEPGVPGSAMLQQNYPNPFNPKTVVSYELRVKSEVRLVVYDALGREVATLVNGKKEPGEHSVEWNAEGLPSGVYYYRLTTPDGIETRKAVLIR